MSRTISAVDDASGDDQIDAAETRVVVVMVDVDDEAGAVDGSGVLTDPPLVRAVDCEQDALGEIVGHLVSRAPSSERNRYSAGSGARPVRYMTGVLAESPQAQREREHRAECVAVGILVRDHEETLVGANRLHDCLRAQSTSRASSSSSRSGRSAASSSISFVMCTPCSTDGSNMKRQRRRAPQAQLAPDP